MHLLTHSALLRALGWTLFNSLWQMSLLWAFYHLFLLVFRNLPARARHGLLLLLLAIGACWSVKTFIMPASELPVRGFSAVLETGRRVIHLLLPWCSALYLLTLGGLLVQYSRHYARCRRILHDGLSRLAPEFRVFVSSTARRMGIRKEVNLHGSSLVDVPVTLGFLRPVILLPVSIVTQLTPTQIEAILVHELAHIRRKDYLLNLLVTAMELLFFFNPFTRGLIAQLKKEREHCCDEQVLEFRYDAHGYVSALLSLARQHGQGRLALAAIGGGGEKLLLQRARKMLQQKRTDDRPGPRLLIFLVCTAIMTLATVGRPGPAATSLPASASMAASAAIAYHPRMFTLERVVILRQVPTPAAAARTAPTVSRHRVAHHSVHPKNSTRDMEDPVTEGSMAILDAPAASKASVNSFAGLVEISNRDFS
ncbi:MAG TPA: M56 family metallopeptidase, partial [Puia sp.]|nr:M56 family metallopeptidase [Puia sp.]